MSSSGAIRAGRAFLELFVDDIKVQQGLKKVSAKMKTWGASMAAAGGKAIAGGLAIAGPLAAAAKVYASMGNELAKASERTGVSVEALSKLKYAADESGTSIESLEGGVKKMQKNLAAAASGNKTAAESFRRLGLNVADLGKMTADQQLAAIADKLANIENPTQRAAEAMKIFGKSGADLLPLLDGGAAGLQDMYSQAEKLGLVMSTEDAKGAEEFTNRMQDLWKVGQSLAFVIGGAVAPVFRSVAIAMTSAVGTIREFVRENKSLVIGAAVVAGGLLAVGSILVSVGTAVGVAGFAIGAVVTTLAAIGGTIAAVVTSPLAAAVLVIGGGVAALLKFTSAGDQLVAVLSPAFAELKSVALTAFGGITDALTSGNWSLAAKILWTALKIEWTNGVNYLAEVWAKLKFALEEKTADLAASMQRLWSYVMEYMSSWAGVKAAATKFLNWMQNAFTSTVNYVADKLQDWFMATGKKQLKVDLAKIDDLEATGKLSHEDADKQRGVARNTWGDYDDKARSKRDQVRKQGYDQNQKDADAEFNKQDSSGVASAENARARIEKEREQARVKHIKELQDQIAQAVDPQQLVELRKQLAQQLTQAHEEAAGQAQTSAERKAKDFSAGLEGAAQSGKTSGTFNAAMAFGFGSGGIEGKIDKTNALLQKIVDKKNPLMAPNVDFATIK